MLAFTRDVALELALVVAAWVSRSGSVQTHPFENGNGRLHRYLVHHVLARYGFSPHGIVVPVAVAI